MLVTMSMKYPHVVAFRCTAEEKAIIDDVVASYPGLSQGTAMREFMMSGDVLEIIRRRSHAYRARQQILALEALRAVLGDDAPPGSTPTDPPDGQEPEAGPSLPASP